MENGDENDPEYICVPDQEEQKDYDPVEGRRQTLRAENRLDVVTFIVSFMFFWVGPSLAIPFVLWAYMIVRQIIIRKFDGANGFAETLVKAAAVVVFAGVAFVADGSEAATFFLFLIFVRTVSFARPFSFAHGMPSRFLRQPAQKSDSTDGDETTDSSVEEKPVAVTDTDGN